ncbi:Uncharacterised protein [Serratia rubidaea]|uniref:Uncharacterized protein n=1 Tax=Serratia rubidaea TaxID=61652 RepID=A0A3S4HZE4_SERRU|nr:Uncharacterised protein [Serratia rubidaea]
MTKQSESKVSDEQQPATGHTRRDVLRLGSLASLGRFWGAERCSACRPPRRRRPTVRQEATRRAVWRRTSR